MFPLSHQLKQKIEARQLIHINEKVRVSHAVSTLYMNSQVLPGICSNEGVSVWECAMTKSFIWEIHNGGCLHSGIFHTESLKRVSYLSCHLLTYELS